MDKRTLFFVIALSLALFGVNMYFDQGRQESLKTWNEQQRGAKLQKLQQLEEEVSAQTAPIADLPLTPLFADAAGKQFLTTGILVENNILTLSWSSELPQTIFAKTAPSNGLKEYNLAFLPGTIGEPVLYQMGEAKALASGDLPVFGTFALQLITPANAATAPVVTHIGNYTNGRFTTLKQQIDQLKKETSPDHLTSAPSSNAIALIKGSKGYLPVGFYNANKNQFFTLDEIAGLNTIVSKADSIATAPSDKTSEKYYVIETPYQQLVFSNRGGALAEINLPFQTEEDQESVVKEIEFDRQMVQDHPHNAYFPAHPYFLPGTKEEVAKGKLGGYYPLIRRDLIESRQRQSIKVSPRYYALNIVSEYPEVAELIYEVKHFDANSIVFESSQNHRRITKTFTIEKDKQAPYGLNLNIKIEGDSRGLWLTTGVPEAEWISGSPAPALKYRITRNEKVSVENVDLPQDSFTVTSVYPDWICNSNGFLGLIADPLTKVDPGYRAEFVAGTVVPSRLVGLDADHGRFKAQELPGYTMMLPLKSTGGVMDFRIFAGPFSDSILKQVDAVYSDSATGYNPDYISCQSFHGWFAFISEPFAKFLFILMKFFHYLTHSWAISIILLTVALRIMMYPLNAWSSKSMIKMQQIAPEVAAIQEKHKKDPKVAQIEVMNLYRDKGVNPVSGCLPMLIQMPFLIGMFDLLKSTFELRGASFIPGWIDDLSAPDVLFRWKTPIFFIGNEFHLLPILLGVVMFAQQRFMSPTVDPSTMTDQQRQQKAMGTIMAVVFTFMFYNFPSGLNIYWLSSMLLGILQQWWTAKRMQKAPVLAVVTPTSRSNKKQKT